MEQIIEGLSWYNGGVVCVCVWGGDFSFFPESAWSRDTCQAVADSVTLPLSSKQWPECNDRWHRVCGCSREQNLNSICHSAILQEDGKRKGKRGTPFKSDRTHEEHFFVILIMIIMIVKKACQKYFYCRRAGRMALIWVERPFWKFNCYVETKGKVEKQHFQCNKNDCMHL